MRPILSAMAVAALTALVAPLPAAGEEENAGRPVEQAPEEDSRPAMSAERAQELVEQLASEEIEQAMAAADELAGAGGAVLPLLLEAAKVKNETVRRRIAGILGRIESERALDALYQMLDDESGGVRREAICAVGNHAREDSVGKLEGFLLKKDHLLRLEAAMALGRIGAGSALPALRRSCLDDDHRVRKAAVVALGLAADESAVPILISRLRDENRMVRTLAHLVLRKMCDTDFEFDPGDDEEKRNEAVELWETWWKTYQKSDTGGNTRKETENNK